jgi:hypothetical protein
VPVGAAEPSATRNYTQQADEELKALALPRYIKISSLVHPLRGKTFIPTFETRRQRELGDGAPEQPSL